MWCKSVQSTSFRFIWLQLNKILREDSLSSKLNDCIERDSECKKGLSWIELTGSMEHGLSLFKLVILMLCYPIQVGICNCHCHTWIYFMHEKIPTLSLWWYEVATKLIAKSLHLMIFLCLGEGISVLFPPQVVGLRVTVTPHFGLSHYEFEFMHMEYVWKWGRRQILYTCFKPFTPLFLQIISVP